MRGYRGRGSGRGSRHYPQESKFGGHYRCRVCWFWQIVSIVENWNSLSLGLFIINCTLIWTCGNTTHLSFVFIHNARLVSRTVQPSSQTFPWPAGFTNIRCSSRKISSFVLTINKPSHDLWIIFQNKMPIQDKFSLVV